MTAQPAVRSLRADERAYFHLLTETVYANPFGEDGARLSQLLARAVRIDGAATQADRYNELLPALETRLDVLRRRGLTRIDQFAAEDQALMRQVFLFHAYQTHLTHFDELIECQRRGERPESRPWLGALCDRLRATGCAEAEVARFVALYYQLRRAYAFIERALVGRGAPMRALRQALWNSLFTRDLRIYALLLWERLEDFSTLLLGESGTGKGAAAAALGRAGPIAFDPRTQTFAHGYDENWVAANLAEFSESLIESALFGHRKGAFTGAIEHRDGLFARCVAQGTLFLDEIGDVPPAVQTKLLRVLQEREFTPVGSQQPRRFAGRIVAATHRPLTTLLRDGGLRQDLYYRLAANVIELPPLRVRLAAAPEELEDLVATLLARLAGPAGEALRDPVMTALALLPLDYPWPGNVRELEQAVRRILLNGHYVPRTAHDAPGAEDPWLAAAAAGRLDATRLLGGYCQRLHARLGTLEAVARAVGWDRRTVRKYLQLATAARPTVPGEDAPR